MYIKGGGWCGVCYMLETRVPMWDSSKRPLYLIIYCKLMYRIHFQGIPFPTSNKKQLVFLRLHETNGTYW